MAVSIAAHCPGLYCGRVDFANGSFSDCGPCPRGTIPNHSSICQECTSSPSFYEWLYLGFMVLAVPTLHFVFIDYTVKLGRHSIVLHVCAMIECAVAAVVTLLSIAPRGHLWIVSCTVHHLSDWYTMFYNPRPDYVHVLHCTHEAAYPMYSLVLIYYAFCLISMIFFRPFVSYMFAKRLGRGSIYAALYFLPALMLTHAVFAGLLFYSFPYILIISSMVSLAVHLSSFKDQDMKSLVLQNIQDPRNLVIIAIHWVHHAYAIVSITQFQDPLHHGPLLLLVPVPTLFYILTVKYTSPSNIYTGI